MLSRLRTQPTLEEMSQAVNLSPSRLRSLFKVETGMSPTEYLKDLRLARARELLETTFLQVKEIRIKVGIPDQSNFVRDFKRKYGVSPTEYRKQIQNFADNNNPDQQTSDLTKK